MHNFRYLERLVFLETTRCCGVLVDGYKVPQRGFQVNEIIIIFVLFSS